MRKYFLISAVALLATTTANATTDYAEVTAKATIEVAGTFECYDIDFGTIVVKQNNEEFIIDWEGKSSSDNLISVSELQPGVTLCSDYWEDPELGDMVDDHYFPDNLTLDDVILKNTNGDTLTLVNMRTENYSIYTDLKIPAKVKPGDYTGTFTVSHTY